MNVEFKKLKDDLKRITDELEEEQFFQKGQKFVIGCSTSEVMGKHIGKDSSLEVAQIVFEHFDALRNKYQLVLMFQGCEHINRAVTLSKHYADQLNYDIVTVVPHRSAGGSLSEYAYTHLKSAVVVESVEADIGIDIGQTLIGMHLKKVAVPVRTSQKSVGAANVTIARTRPKLIGGPRAKYNN